MMEFSAERCFNWEKNEKYIAKTEMETLKYYNLIVGIRNDYIFSTFLVFYWVKKRCYEI